MPRDTLTRDQIVTAAIALLDDEGLEGLNMRALGRRLDSAATAMYWHVGGKDNLVMLAGDQVWQEITLPDLAATGWRAAAIEMATGLHDMLTRHPWLVQAFGSYFVYGPGKARYDDHNLAIFEAAGFAGALADRAAATVFTFVLGNALGPAAEATLNRKFVGTAEESMREDMTRAVEIAGGFPRLRARFDAAGTEYAAPPARTFEFGLRAVVDGLAAQLDTV
jgi:AcrR family transcriptional regulator